MPPDGFGAGPAFRTVLLDAAGAGRQPSSALAFRVDSVSSSGLAVLVLEEVPEAVRRSGLGFHEGDRLRFRYPVRGLSLEAEIVWVEWSRDRRRLELIVDTGEAADWSSLHVTNIRR